MKHLVNLKNSDGETVFINPDHIVTIAKDGNEVYIHLDNGNDVIVLIGEYDLAELIEKSYEWM